MHLTNAMHQEMVRAYYTSWYRDLVTELPRRAGQKENRWAQLLGGEPEEAEESAAVGTVAAPTRVSARGDRVEALEQEVAALREEVAELRAELRAFKGQFE